MMLFSVACTKTNSDGNTNLDVSIDEATAAGKFRGDNSYKMKLYTLNLLV